MPSYSGLYNNEFGENYAPLGSNITQGNALTALTRVFGNRIYGRGVARELMYALTGAAAGSNASSSHKRVKAERDLESNLQGGKRVIETFTGINRVTTSADADAIKAALRMKNAPTSYPVDRSGNGGGNKLGW